MFSKAASSRKLDTSLKSRNHANILSSMDASYSTQKKRQPSLVPMPLSKGTPVGGEEADSSLEKEGPGVESPMKE